MKTQLKRYPEYRRAHLEWLRPIPEHWTERRAKYFLREVDERSQSGLEELLSVSHLTGVTPRSEKNVTMFKAESYVGHKLCRPGDVVVNTMWAWMCALGVTEHEGLVSPAYGVYRPIEAGEFHPRYLDHLLRTPALAAEYFRRSTGIRPSRLRLYPDKFLEIPLICPPLDEQEAIAARIASVNHSIGSFIRGKRTQLKFLDEQEASIVEHAVTRGLDDRAELQPSVIEGVAEVPAHWSLSKVKYIAAYLNGAAFKPEQWSDHGQKIIRIQNLTGEDSNYNFFDGELQLRYLVRKGDILLSWSASLGVFVWAGEDAWLNQHIFKVTPDETRVTTDYYVWLARWFLGYMAREAHGSTMQHVTKGKFGGLPVYLPPLREQEEIAAQLAQSHDAIDQVRHRITREIELILQLRDCLISDLVTGQRDVHAVPRDQQPEPPPDEIDNALRAYEEVAKVGPIEVSDDD